MKYLNENPIEKLHPEEPYFFIRGQDKLSVESVQAYAGLLLKEGLIAQYAEVYEIVKAMERWQRVNPDKVKLPDSEVGLPKLQQIGLEPNSLSRQPACFCFWTKSSQKTATLFVELHTTKSTCRWVSQIWSR